jgi:hypothetical protein
LNGDLITGDGIQQLRKWVYERRLWWTGGGFNESGGAESERGDWAISQSGGSCGVIGGSDGEDDGIGWIVPFFSL